MSCAAPNRATTNSPPRRARARFRFTLESVAQLLSHPGVKLEEKQARLDMLAEIESAFAHRLVVFR